MQFKLLEPPDGNFFEVFSLKLKSKQEQGYYASSTMF